jgi:hypothetical protein
VRIGENPAKAGREVRSDAQIRVVVPVYIPGEDVPDGGYFAEAAAILDLCLDSLLATSGAETRITVVANACRAEVVDALAGRHRAGAIDQLIVSHDNLGKVDGFLAGARASWEPIVVVSDADVLWRPGWQAALTEILATFPECGVVGAAPLPNLAAYATSATVLEALVDRVIGRRTVVDPEDLTRFAQSVGNPGLFDRYVEDQLVVERAGVTALVGAGHFACGFRRAALDDVAPGPCLGFERESLDFPLDAAGWWRLATTSAFAWHLGNVVEPWMSEQLTRPEEPEHPGQPERIDLPDVDRGQPSWLGRVPVGLRDRLAVRLGPRISSRR